MSEWLKRLFYGSCVGLLETELARERAETERLRAENRALTNSLLGTAGFPPVEYPEAAKPQPIPRLRKRSWHQIQAWREHAAGSTSPDPLEITEGAHRSSPDSPRRPNGAA
jgi:hypothetical protein